MSIIFGEGSDIAVLKPPGFYRSIHVAVTTDVFDLSNVAALVPGEPEVAIVFTYFFGEDVCLILCLLSLFHGTKSKFGLLSHP